MKNGFHKRLEVFFMNLPEQTKAIYRSDEDGLYIGINNNLAQSCIDLIENKPYKIVKAPA